MDKIDVDNGVTIINSDCLAVMRDLEENSVDAIVTDPPYGLRFMGKNWDHGVPGPAFWSEALRVAKPGAHLLAFGGTRTFHRLACAIEDAGWEIRDTLMWVYGSGFPKSLDISKKLDNTEAAKQWSGWGTALKPSFEPIIMARKPLIGTVAENVLKYGTGGINIDGCRISLNGGYKCKANGRPSLTGIGDNYDPLKANQLSNIGRWPANFIHDGSDEVVELFPQSKSSGGEPLSGEVNQHGIYGSRNRDRTGKGCGLGDSGSAARFFYTAKASQSDRDEGCEGLEERLLQKYKDFEGTPEHAPKQNVKARNHHPTVKPTDLMRYLCRLVTPPKGVILDSFMGSGSTGKAAILERFQFIGIEREAEYLEIARCRLEHALSQGQLDLV